MRHAQDAAARTLLAVLVLLLAAALLWMLVRRVLVLIGLVAIALLAVRLAVGGFRGGRDEVHRCASCAREIPDDTRICPYCFELAGGSWVASDR
ncbi:MAG TPA: hypothetical protein VNT32_09445 [Thermoleophilaceae bacterium]|nr:hypothetical protein [Thermoleophilaceae bacterium]